MEPRPGQCPGYNGVGVPVQCVLEEGHEGDDNFGGTGPYQFHNWPVTSGPLSIEDNTDYIRLRQMLDQMKRERDWIYMEAEHLADFAGFQTNALRVLRAGVAEMCGHMDQRWASAAFVDLHECVKKLRQLLTPTDKVPTL